MLFDEAALLKELETLAKKYDAAAEVLIVNRTPEGVQALHVRNFAIVVQPNNSELINALIAFGLEKENEVKFIGSQIDLQAKNPLDVLQVDAKIYYKKG